MPATLSEINAVLNDLRDSIRNKRFIPINRKKNLYTLAYLGITWDDAKDEILHLTAADYHSGPNKDRDIPNSDPLWVFKKKICGEWIYIKFKIERMTTGDTKVISFHIDHM